MKQALKNWHDEHLGESTFADKLADHITAFVGSWVFIIMHVIWFGIWIILPVEPFPFGLLTMIVSLEAILLSTFIMISQNRASDRDRAQADADYQTDLQAKLEIEDLQTRLARIETEKLDEILRILKQK
jgi:uncharacterized membrane protein